MRRIILTWAWLWTACGPAGPIAARPAPPDHQPDGPSDVTSTPSDGAEARSTETLRAGPDTGPTTAATENSPSAVDNILGGLSGIGDAELEDAVAELDADELHAALAHMDPEASASAWAALRVGRVLAHRRRFAKAERVLAEAVAAHPVHPAAPRMRETLRRLAARRRVEPRRIGVLLPLSGPYGAIGQSALGGIELAAIVAGNVELKIEDTAGDDLRAVQGVERLVFEHRVGAIIGPIGAIESRAAAIAADSLEVPIVTLTSGSGTPDLGPFVFRHRLTRVAQARAIAQYAMERMGFVRFAILYPEGDYGREMMRAFWHTVESLGGEIRGAQGYPLHATDFAGPIKKLIGRHHLEARRKDAHWEELNRKSKDKALHVPPVVDFEAIFIPDLGHRGRMVLPFLSYWDIELRTSPELDPYQLRRKYGGRMPQLVQVLSASGFNDSRFAERAGPSAHNSVFVDAWLPDHPRASGFVDAYVTAHEHRPGALAAHAFDATRMVAQAAAGASDRAELRRALLDIEDFDGVVGRTNVEGNGEIAIDLTVLTIDPEHGIVPRTEELGADDAPPQN